MCILMLGCKRVEKDSFFCVLSPRVVGIAYSFIDEVFVVLSAEHASAARYGGSFG